MALVYLAHKAQGFVISCRIEENRTFPGFKLLAGVGPFAELDGILCQTEKSLVELFERRAVRPALKNFSDFVAGGNEWTCDNRKAWRQSHRRVANHVGRLDLFSE